MPDPAQQLDLGEEPVRVELDPVHVGADAGQERSLTHFDGPISPGHTLNCELELVGDDAAAEGRSGRADKRPSTIREAADHTVGWRRAHPIIVSPGRVSAASALNA